MSFTFFITSSLIADLRAIEPEYERAQVQRLKGILDSLKHDAT
ncbi:hypothetical protein [Variovorax paradoxus]|nr:hypothetical protein [Variovorax paradoxus]MDQ0586386.1 hypothetical protein [Variovorax paradoxus]